MKRAAWAMAVVGLSGACTSFESTDSPGRDGDDAGVGKDANAGVDGSADGNAGDGGATIDGGHTFFDDFDRGALGATWTATSGGAPVTFELDSTTAFSQPSSVHATLPKGSGVYTLGAHLMKRFDRSTKSLTCGFRVFVLKHSEASTPSILDVAMRVPANATYKSANAGLSISGQGASMNIVQDGAGEPSYPAASLSIRTGAWLPLTVAIDADTRTAVVSLEGKTYVNGTFPAPLRPNEGFQIKLGLFETNDGDSVDILYDDFFCDVVYDG